MTDTAYDAVAYPSSLFAQTHIDRLAMIARLFGLTAPEPETARVLEIGGGDGLNLIAMAAIYPRARFYNFDLAASPVARGQALIAAAGLDNVRVEVGDILDAVETLDGPFDYVIAHGVYAWVPDVVREATMQLIGRVLSPDGVALVSYNAKPGGYIRLALRDMLLRQVAGVEDPVEKVARARAFLTEYSQRHAGEPEILQGLRAAAGDLLEKDPAVLFHDELGGCFYPQSVTDVAQAAKVNGLQYLGDAGRALVAGAFVSDVEVTTDEVVLAAQTSDEDKMRFFRHSLLVRDTARPSHVFDPARLRGLYVSLKGEATEPGVYVSHNSTYKIADPRLSALLDRLAEVKPARLPVDSLTDDDDVLDALFRLFDIDMVGLHLVTLPAALPADIDAVGQRYTWRPRANSVALVQARENHDRITTLSHVSLSLQDPAARAFLVMLDGTHTLEGLEARWNQTEFADAMPFDKAFDMAAQACLLAKD